jgi:hypothetical protein
VCNRDRAQHTEALPKATRALRPSNSPRRSFSPALADVALCNFVDHILMYLTTPLVVLLLCTYPINSERHALFNHPARRLWGIRSAFAGRARSPFVALLSLPGFISRPSHKDYGSFHLPHRGGAHRCLALTSPEQCLHLGGGSNLQTKSFHLVHGDHDSRVPAFGLLEIGAPVFQP